MIKWIKTIKLSNFQNTTQYGLEESCNQPHGEWMIMNYDLLINLFNKIFSRLLNILINKFIE